MVSLAISAIILFHELATMPRYIPYIKNAMTLITSQPNEPQSQLPMIPEDSKNVNANISFIGNFSPASVLGSDFYGTFNSFIHDIDILQYSFKDITGNDVMTIASCNAVLAPSDSLKDIDISEDGAWLLGPEENAMIYSVLGIDAVSLETEHILDYSDVGKIATQTALESSDIKTFDSRDPLIIDLGPISACVLTARFTQAAPSIAGLIRIAKSIYDVVIVYGEADDSSAQPSEWRVSAAHEMIDAGADAVIQYTDKVQPVERYNDGFIAYSLGNFLDGSVSPTEDSVSLILSLNIKQSGSHSPTTSFLIVPCISNSDGWIPSPAHDPEHVENALTIN